MIALFFEVTPAAGQEARYLDMAASLRPALEANGGVLYLDRYRSLARSETLLSHQIWVDEASLTRWRANAPHHAAQTAGRRGIFQDYRLRVGVVVAEVGEGRHIATFEPGVTYNAPSVAAERYMVVVRCETQALSPAGGETWRSVYADGRFAWVGSVANRAAGMELLESVRGEACVSAAQLCLVSRDYGMFDRREAPQYFPPIGPNDKT
jgi:heme-degrading monooxygenase HmoA